MSLDTLRRKGEVDSTWQKTKTFTHSFSPIRLLMRFVLCCGAKFTRKDLFRDAVCNSNLLNYNIALIHEKRDLIPSSVLHNFAGQI